jgi:histidine phosphotransferase ChpT
MIDANLAGVVCARICHDLANPVGAIVNGADLVREVGLADAARELALLDQSAQRAAALLTLHRLAFGSRRDQGTALDLSQLHGHIIKVLSGPRVSLTWNASRNREVSGAEARLITLMALAGRAMLGMTGELTVTCPDTAALAVSIAAKGPKAAVTAPQRDWLTGSSEALPDSRQIEFALIPAALADARARLEILEEDRQVTLRAEQR